MSDLDELAAKLGIPAELSQQIGLAALRAKENYKATSQQGVFSIRQHAYDLELMVCKYDLSAIRTFLLNEAFIVRAFAVSAESCGVEFDQTNADAWRELRELINRRSDLFEHAAKLVQSREFFEKEEAQVQRVVDAQMKGVTHNRLWDAVTAAFNEVLDQVSGEFVDWCREGLGLDVTTAREKHSEAAKKSRKLLRTLGVTRVVGRPKGSKNKKVKFSYQKFKQAIKADNLKQLEVALAMGYASARPLQRALKDRWKTTFEKHGHKDRRWGGIVRHILKNE